MRIVDPIKHAQKRDEILRAAAACFADRGLHGTRTADICTRVGMSPGNLFHYFPSKHAIFTALVAARSEEIDRLLAGLSKADDPLVALFWLLDLIADLAADAEYSGLTLEISAEAHRDEIVAELVADSDRQLRDGLRELVRRAAAAGRIDDTLEPTTAATWLSALIDGTFARVAADPTFSPIEQAATLRLIASRFLQVDGI